MDLKLKTLKIKKKVRNPKACQLYCKDVPRAEYFKQKVQQKQKTCSCLRVGYKAAKGVTSGLVNSATTSATSDVKDCRQARKEPQLKTLKTRKVFNAVDCQLYCLRVTEADYFRWKANQRTCFCLGVSYKSAKGVTSGGLGEC